MHALTFNPFDPEPMSTAHAPIARRPIIKFAPGYFFVSRYEDVRTILENTVGYRSGGDITWHRNAAAILYRKPSRTAATHLLFQQALHPQLLSATGTFIARALTGFIEQLVQREEADLMEEIAVPLSLLMMARLIGIPEVDILDLRSWITEMQTLMPHSVFGLYEPANWHDFNSYVHHMIDTRSSLKHPPDDLVTQLMHAQMAGTRLSDDEIRTAIVHLMVAGSETMAYFIGNLLFDLLEVPQRWQRLREKRSLLESALQESLRYHSPISWVMRTSTKTSIIQGVKIGRNARVVLSLASANRDEACWSEPDIFAFERPELHQHLAFGHGTHTCPGAALASLVAKTILEALLTHFPHLRLIPSFQYQVRGGPAQQGPQCLHVTWKDAL